MNSAYLAVQGQSISPVLLSEPPTLLDWWDQFVQERSFSLCPTSLSSDYRQARTWLSRCPIQDPHQPKPILYWVLSQEPVLASRRVAMFLKALYRWASQEDPGLIARNPLTSFKMPKAPQRDEEVVCIQRDEIPLVLEALKITPPFDGRPWNLYADFMLQTAMRTGEVRALHWEDIKGDKILVHRNWTLTHGLKASTKTNKKRWVPLNSKARAVLEQLPRESEFLFPWKRTTFMSHFRARMARLHREQRVTHVYRPYDLRHTAISHWIEAGIPIPQVANWAGNTSEVIFKHYANTTKEYIMPEI